MLRAVIGELRSDFGDEVQRITLIGWKDTPVEFPEQYKISTQRSQSATPPLARISHRLSTAAAYPGMSTALRSFGLLDVLSSTPAEPSVARLVSMPVCAASLRNPLRNAG